MDVDISPEELAARVADVALQLGADDWQIRPRAYTTEEKQRHQLQGEIDLLKEQVQGIEHQIMEQELLTQRSLDVANVLSVLSAKSLKRGPKPALTRVQTEIDAEIAALASISGISFSSAENRLLEHGRTRQYIFRGSSYGLTFRTEFDVDETSLAITRLQIQVPSEAVAEIAQFLQSVERDCSLQVFFVGFARYSELCQARGEILSFIAERYAQVVTVPRGRFTTAICFVPAAAKASLQFSLQWNLDINQHGGVTQNVVLVPRVSWDVVHADSTRVLTEMPANFQLLVKLKGLRTALVILAEMLK